MNLLFRDFYTVRKPCFLLSRSQYLVQPGSCMIVVLYVLRFTNLLDKDTSKLQHAVMFWTA